MGLQRVGDEWVTEQNINTNRLKGLDLVDSDWRTKDGGLYHCIGGVTKTIQEKKKYKKSKWLSKKALQIAEKRREVKCKGERERYTKLNAELQGTVWRDKKKSFFLSEQCKEKEESNRIGKTGNIFKKVRDNRGILHAKMGTIKDRNSKDLREAEEIKKRWQEIQRITTHKKRC